MLALLAANLTVFLHLLFVLFVLFGALLTLRWRWTLWLHLPAVVWGIWIEFSSGLCPLTPLEKHFRHMAGEAGYPGGFVAEYILPFIYPVALTRELQLLLGVGVLVLNLLIYGALILRKRI